MGMMRKSRKCKRDRFDGVPVGEEGTERVMVGSDVDIEIASGDSTVVSERRSLSVTCGCAAEMIWQRRSNEL
jgi:hypothetical protein